MKTRIASLALLTATSLLCTAGAAPAQDGAAAPARPMFLAPPPHGQQARHAPGAKLVQWNGTFTDLTGVRRSFTMAGTNATKTTMATTIQVLVVPIKMVYGNTNGNMTFDPNADMTANHDTVTTDIAASPVFNNIDFKQRGTDLGTTQYIDAFQRGNFWFSVHKNGGGYHILFNTTFMTEQTIEVTPAEGSVIDNPFAAGVVGSMDYNTFDSILQGFIKKMALANPGVLPLFVTDNIFLIYNGHCCVGGYHSAEAPQPAGQTYSYATYVTTPGSFSQDVSALSHELGEWVDDPFIDNIVGCTDNSLMEVGDPLEGSENYGDYPYVLNGSTYNLQSLVFIGYFGGKPATSLHKWRAFQNDMNHVCPGQ